VPHQPVEDRGRPLRAPARRAGRPPPPLTHHPRLFVITGPSGAGKGTLIQALVERRSDFEVAISATTRPRRPGEIDGRDYYFLSEEEFRRRVDAGEFLEHVVYVSGQCYGTLNVEVERILGAGRSCILELETSGARTVKETMPEAVTIFIAAPTFSELERRLRERATESAGEIDERLDLARRQLAEAPAFDFVVTNDDLERAADKLENIVSSAVGRLSRT
jgi:guanylate kinase